MKRSIEIVCSIGDMLQIAICEEDQKERKQLQALITGIFSKYSICCNIAVFNSGEELLASSLMFHLIFLDVKLKGQDGIEIGKKIYRRNRSIKVIIQTNDKEYCNAAINQSHAFGFLEKPVDKSLLEDLIREFLEVQGNEQEIWMEFKHVYPDNKKQEVKECLKLPVRDILYFEYIKRDKNIKIHTLQGDFMCLSTIGVLEQRMRNLGFELCNRGILVNLDKIRKIKRYNIILSNDTVIPLSQRRAAYFKERLNEFAGNAAFRMQEFSQN